MLPTDLPPVALIALGVTLAIIFAINRFGFMQGRAGPATASAASAQVAAVIVDPAALNHATAAVEALTMAVTESNVIARQQSAATYRMAKSIEDMGEATDRLRDEVIRSAAKMK